MRAFVINGKQDGQVGEVPTPEPGPGQVRLRISYVGICGSDLHYWFNGANGAFKVTEPLIPGHEVSGTVDLDPSGRLAPGTPVTVHPATFGDCVAGLEDHKHLWPNGAYLGSASTKPHTQGGMSEYLIVDAPMVRILPEGLDLRTAALAEPLAVVLHGINVAGGVAGKRVLVSGSGPIGLLAAAAALASGAAEVTSTDLLAGPLQRAKAIGVHHTIGLAEQKIPTESYDVALECAGVPVAVDGCIAGLKKTGILAQVGMLPAGGNPIDLASLISKEIQLRGCFRFNDEIDQAVTMLAANPQIAAVVTHTIGADEVLDAFNVAKDSQVSGKVLVDMWTGQ